jgi:hypothetical protein
MMNFTQYHEFCCDLKIKCPFFHDYVISLSAVEVSSSISVRFLNFKLSKVRETIFFTIIFFYDY